MAVGTARLGRDFNRLWASSAPSNLADGVFQVALPLLAVTLTTRPALVAGVVLARSLPWLFMALPAGALADRLDRRTTMIRVEVLRVVVMACLAVAVAVDVASIPLLYVAAVVLGVGETLFDTAAMSILPALVGRDDLNRANGRLQAVELTTNQFLGPPLGGVLAAAALATAFAVVAGAYLAAALCLVAVAGSFRPAPRSSPTTLRADIVEGLRFVFRHPILRTLGVMLGVTNLAFTAHQSVFVLFAVRPGPLGLSRAGFGLLLASAAIGGVAASMVVTRLEGMAGRSPLLAAVVVVFGVSLAVPAVTDNLAANVVALVVAAFGGVTWNVVTVSLRQRITPDDLLGRMNATYRLLGWGTMPLGAVVGGLVAEWAGLRTAFAVGALLHVPMLLGFLVVTETRIAAAEADAGVDVTPHS